MSNVGINVLLILNFVAIVFFVVSKRIAIDITTAWTNFFHYERWCNYIYIFKQKKCADEKMCLELTSIDWRVFKAHWQTIESFFNDEIT